MAEPVSNKLFLPTIARSHQVLLLDMVDLAGDRFNEAFLESAPQAVIQIYIAATTFDSWTQILSIIISLASLSLATTDYTSYKYEANPLRWLWKWNDESAVSVRGRAQMGAHESTLVRKIKR